MLSQKRDIEAGQTVGRVGGGRQRGGCSLQCPEGVCCRASKRWECRARGQSGRGRRGQAWPSQTPSSLTLGLRVGVTWRPAGYEG